MTEKRGYRIVADTHETGNNAHGLAERLRQIFDYNLEPYNHIIRGGRVHDVSARRVCQNIRISVPTHAPIFSGPLHLQPKWGIPGHCGRYVKRLSAVVLTLCYAKKGREGQGQEYSQCSRRQPFQISLCRLGAMRNFWSSLRICGASTGRCRPAGVDRGDDRATGERRISQQVNQILIHLDGRTILLNQRAWDPRRVGCFRFDTRRLSDRLFLETVRTCGACRGHRRPAGVDRRDDRTTGERRISQQVNQILIHFNGRTILLNQRAWDPRRMGCFCFDTRRQSDRLLLEIVRCRPREPCLEQIPGGFRQFDEPQATALSRIV
jgi:hypothetical protein